MIPDALVFLAACVLIGGPIMLLVVIAAHALGWGVEDTTATAEPWASTPPPPSSCREDGRVACSCRHELRDDGRGAWDSVTVEDVVDERCPIHGPAGRGWEWIDVTTCGDDGVRCIRGGRIARHASTA